ncbi:hypothetical protein [Xylophilus ampelinus]|uniref:Alpha/beta hydrolase family protein n=1 Tax=Xylophilus ampelinus TaxID=54067 RepID=A0A318SGU6_9BURK|nr:hypothetical protein [Xylophilus ampelinus]PYE77845.1 hypothetical protein DFQ15_11298 [Xylophilus ampelinus]
MPRLYRDFETQEQIDAQYDTAIPAADRAAEMRHYAERSAHARATLRCELRVPYGPTRAETLDIFPADAPGAPVFVFIHGGYWRALSANDFTVRATASKPSSVPVLIAGSESQEEHGVSRTGSLQRGRSEGDRIRRSGGRSPSRGTFAEHSTPSARSPTAPGPTRSAKAARSARYCYIFYS